MQSRRRDYLGQQLRDSIPSPPSGELILIPHLIVKLTDADHSFPSPRSLLSQT
jgi:hypothetical protein